mgnify:CR=1 FL=1
MATIEELQNKTQEKMDKALQALRNELTNIRTGRATPSLLDQGEGGLLWGSHSGDPGGQRVRAGTPDDCDPTLGPEPAEGH